MNEGGTSLKKDSVPIKNKEKKLNMGSRLQKLSKPIPYKPEGVRNLINEEKAQVQNVAYGKHDENMQKIRLNRYAALVQELSEIKVECHTIEEIAPYEIPVFYSLDYESRTIAMMDNRTHIIKKRVIKSDTKSLALDWKNVGRDINVASTRYRENFSKSQ